MERATAQASSTLVAEPFAGEGIFRSSSSLPKSLRSSARSMFAGSVPMIGHAGGLQRQRQRQRRLPAELDDHAVRLLGVADVQHFFERERLEVEAVAGVVIGGDGLRIAVDHDRFDAEFLQREGRVAAAVIELDSLADAVGAAAQDHDLLARGDVGFALGFVARIEIRREAFELGGAGIDAIEHGRDAEFFAARADFERRRRSRPRARKLSEMPSRLAASNCSRVDGRSDRVGRFVFRDRPSRAPGAGTRDRWRSARAPALRCSRARKRSGCSRGGPDWA